ncbi:MAG TPA: alcohol dehydrogenase catalytic domain-containing protein [Candidatus Acidoferrales bacterium]|nr:alcohol dehydrogenase catalytic domain-containing protein [Candidatus Acidoferrales bacterium]
MPGTSRGATLVAPGVLEIREYPLPEIPPDGGLVAVERAGVCGSDVKYFYGKIALPLPVILGHEILGRVVKLGSAAAAIHKVSEGDRVIFKGAIGCGRCADCRRGASRFCRQRTSYGGRTSSAKPPHLFGGFADYVYVAPDVLLTKVSDSLAPEAAILVGAVMANGFQWAIRRGGVKIGDFVLIQGPGQQGLACAFAARHAGAARVFVSGLKRDGARLALAKRFGADRVICVEEENVFEVIRAETDGAMADVVVDASGSPQAIQVSLDCLRNQGTLVLGGLTGDSTITPLLLDKLVWRELRVQGVFTADNDAVDATLRFLQAIKFPVEEMVSHVFALAETERCIRAVGGEIPDLFPTKAVIKP